MPTIEGLLEDYSKGIVRGQLRKIVEIYDPEWIMVHELVQNALDAIQANHRVAEGLIELTLDLDNDTVTVTDNGTGFVCDLELLCPGGTGDEKRLTSRSPTKGYQGVGLKAVMYSTTRFEIVSQTEDKSWTFLTENLNAYLDPEETIDPEYDMEEEEESSETTYTTVTASFPEGSLKDFLDGLNRFLKEDSIKWQQLYQEEKDRSSADPTDKYLEHFFGWYFRTKSYVGCVNRLLSVPVKNVNTEELEEVKPIVVKLILRSSSKFENVDDIIGSWLSALDSEEFETEIPNLSWDYHEVAIENLERSARYRIAPTIVTKKPSDPDWEDFKPTFRNKFLDIKLVPDESKTDFREKYSDIIALLERPRSRVRAEDYQDVLESITGIYLAIGRTSYFETLGISNRGIRLIASNGTPTAHDLNVVSTSSTWYLETIHMIINVDETLNLGKRHLVNNRLVGRIREFFQECYRTLVHMSQLFVERDSGGPPDDPLPDVVGINRIRRQGIPFRRFPEDENTLLGLFSSIIDNQDPEFSVYGYFSRGRYDGKFLWEEGEPLSDADLRKLEFKRLLDRLIQEFEHAIDDKDFREVDLIIVWDRRVEIPGWHVKGISRSRRLDLESRGVPTTWIEYVLEDRHGQYRPLICVADLLNNIPLVDGENDDIASYVEELG